MTLAAVSLKFCISGPVILVRLKWHNHILRGLFYELLINPSMTSKSVTPKHNSTTVSQFHNETYVDK